MKKILNIMLKVLGGLVALSAVGHRHPVLHWQSAL